MKSVGASKVYGKPDLFLILVYSLTENLKLVLEGVKHQKQS